jgi:P4 family phage/plasmid primase-like protien
MSSKTYGDLFDFLRAHKTTKEEGNITHTRIGNKKENVYGGSYSIPDEELDLFYKLYHEHVFVKNKPEYLTEVQRKSDSIPCLIDLDFRYTPKVKTRQHGIEHIEDLCRLYMAGISELFEMEGEETKVDVYVFQKPSVNTTSSKMTKDGVHIVICLHMDHIQQMMLREYVCSRAESVLGDLGLTNSYGDVFDDCISKGTTNWQLFGSKKPGGEAYQLARPFRFVFFDDGSFELEARSKSRVKPLEILTRATARMSSLVRLDMKKEHQERYNTVRDSNQRANARALAGGGGGGETVGLVAGLFGGAMSAPLSLADINSQEKLDAAVEAWLKAIPNDKYFIRETHQYTMMLPEEYYGPGSYDKWMRVGWALANTHPSMIITWIALSARSPAFEWSSIDDIVDRWSTFSTNNPDGLTARSIMYWCKNADEEAFLEVKNTTINHYIERNLGEIRHYDIAQVVYQVFKDEYRCVQTKKGNDWYQFKNHRWVNIGNGSSLRNNISETISALYGARGSEYLRMSNLESRREEMYDGADAADAVASADDAAGMPKKSALYQKYSGELSKVSNDLRDTNYKRSIMSDAADIFHNNDPEFAKNLDQNIYLMGFNNGVFDFQTNEFRPGRPEDYITKSTGINYVPFNPRSSMQAKAREEITSMVDKIFPHEELRRYMWEHMASILIGRNFNQTFNIYNGSGSNGKSIIIEFLCNIMGDYACQLPVAYVTEKRPGIGQVSPELFDLVGARLAYMSEPTKGMTLNDGVMKELTGGDVMKANPKYRDPIEFRPQFKLVVCTNTLFNIGSNDDGTWRRIRLCEFESKFSNSARPTAENPYVFKPDVMLPAKIGTVPDGPGAEQAAVWKQVFMSMLVEIATRTRGLVADCDKVLEASNRYRADQDCYTQFFDEHIVQGVESDSIKVKEVKRVFKEWYIASFSQRPPKAKELEDFLNKRIGKRNRTRGWVGYKLVLDEHELDAAAFNPED